MKISISNNAEEIFRKLAMKKFGYKKGAISMAAEEAIEDWTDSSYEDEEFFPIKNPTEAISGLLKHVKKNSVELQHEVGDILAKKYANRRKHFS